MIKLLPILLIVSVLVISGCTQNSQPTSTKLPSTSPQTILSTPQQTTTSPTISTSPSKQSGCVGFTYFSIKNHKLTQSTLMLDVQNGDKDVIITGIGLGDKPMGTSLTPISANGRTVVVTDTTGKTAGSKYDETLTIDYSIGDSSDKHEDKGRCTGIVQ